MLNESFIDDPIVYIYCPTVSHEILCKNYFKYNDWGCKCKYKVLYIRNYINCSQVANECDLIKYIWNYNDIKNYTIYCNWRQKREIELYNLYNSVYNRV